ncbi:MAG: replication protein RepA [Hyphomicrobiaceae bacterium]
MAVTIDEPTRKIATLSRRVTDAALSLVDPLNTQPEFMHAVLCQVGLPRSEVKSREFTRTTGGASMLIEAGKWFDGFRYHDMPLPYGTRPRLVLFHVCSEAIRNKSPEVEVERSASAFLERIGIAKGGESMVAFKRQMLALAACRMQIGYQTESKVVNVKCDPISRFDAWMQYDNGQLGMWPGVITLSSEFYGTLTEHAVPLDPRAIRALQNSALALDAYTWLAHRLCRVRQNKGITLYWKNLKDQFGQEYRSDKDFKREFAGALRKAHAVYPDAKIDIVRGGLKLFPSPPPVKRRQVVVALPAPLIAEPADAGNTSSPVSSAPVLAQQPACKVELPISPECQTEAQSIAAGWDMNYLQAMYAELLANLAKPPRDQDANYLRWLRAFTRGRDPVTNGADAPVAVLTIADLKSATLAEAKQIAQGWDLRELERVWRAWVQKGGVVPHYPDRAFLGWVRKFTKNKRP